MQSFILRHIDLLLGNNRETNEITTIAKQQLRKYATVAGQRPAHNNGSTTNIMFLDIFHCPVFYL
jgi:hypothetical protein